MEKKRWRMNPDWLDLGMTDRANSQINHQTYETMQDDRESGQK
jgi:hypothetical protein